MSTVTAGVQNKVIHGDCLEVMPSIPDKSIDMILCDLPYGTRRCKWDIILPFDELWGNYNKLIKDNGAIVLFGSEPFSSALRMTNIKAYRYDWKWDKDQAGNFAMAKKQPLKTYEDIMVFYKKQSMYKPTKIPADHQKIRPISDGARVNTYITQNHSTDYDNTKRYPKAIVRYSANNGECNKLHRLHPTQKPVALFEYLIGIYTNEGETVLDNCAGSGTTAIACLNTNRNYILIEKEKECIDIINKRTSEHELQVSIY